VCTVTLLGIYYLEGNNKIVSPYLPPVAFPTVGGDWVFQIITVAALHPPNH
jgi:hypothetical protein